MLPPGPHVLRAFGLADTVPEAVSDGNGESFRCGDALLTPVGDPALSSWLSSVMEQVRPDGVRVARPLRSSDGRWVVAGWSARRFVAGAPEPRHDEVVRVSIALHRALADVPEPRLLHGRQDVYAQADGLAWDRDDDPAAFGDGAGARLFGALARGRRAVTSTDQLIHGDLFGAVLFDPEQPPAVVDLRPLWRPANWAAAIVVVDALAWGGADLDLVQRWGSVPEWPQLLRRAVLFRLAVSLLHPRTTPESLVQIMTAAEVLQPLLD